MEGLHQYFPKERVYKGMTSDQAKAVIEESMESIKNGCDIVSNPTEMVEAYERVLRVFDMSKKYRKEMERYKRKYIHLKAEVKEDNDDGMLPSLLFNVFGLVMIFLLYKIAFG